MGSAIHACELPQCNTERMNSWHSWSPNSKWLMFSSKTNSDYTHLLLTHIDDAGQSTPPVELPQFVIPGRAANIPEFVNAKVDAIASIREQFLDDYSYARAGSESLKYGEPDAAERLLRLALQANPKNANAHNNLGTILADRGQFHEAEKHCAQSLENDPTEHDARRNLAAALMEQGKIDEAIACYRQILQVGSPAAQLSIDLALALLGKGAIDEASDVLASATRFAPANVSAHFYLGMALHRGGHEQRAAEGYRAAIRLQPDYQRQFRSPLMLCRSPRPAATLPLPASSRNACKSTAIASASLIERRRI